MPSKSNAQAYSHCPTCLAAKLKVMISKALMDIASELTAAALSESSMCDQSPRSHGNSYDDSDDDEYASPTEESDSDGDSTSGTVKSGWDEGMRLRSGTVLKRPTV